MRFCKKKRRTIGFQALCTNEQNSTGVHKHKFEVACSVLSIITLHIAHTKTFVVKKANKIYNSVTYYTYWMSTFEI